ncbi:hypothetical protein CORC01_03377 [Colletotrichum orchidophilum]|uniref:Uncharacterized protein n=1 Tax=Colletotrichum orchidophilum TaxID=1209926 RepID=A0A1G4BIV1_9PEZI|nr:uncharacterized protein CORC01_03377 [Colletotrichum orchidophilum]OHF01344.1 hypothetical protein CORC01_03377 [Colletotrichum orchidophilum]
MARRLKVGLDVKDSRRGVGVRSRWWWAVVDGVGRQSETRAMPGAGGRTSNRLAPAPAGPVSLEHAAPTRPSGGGSLPPSVAAADFAPPLPRYPCSEGALALVHVSPYLFHIGAKMRYLTKVAEATAVKAEEEGARDLTYSTPAWALSLVEFDVPSRGLKAPSPKAPFPLSLTQECSSLWPPWTTGTRGGAEI